MIISLTSSPKIEFNSNNPVILALLPLLIKATILHYKLHRNQKQLLLSFKSLYERLLGAHLFTVRVPHLPRVSL